MRDTDSKVRVCSPWESGWVLSGGEYVSGSHSVRGMGEAEFFHGVPISVHLRYDSVSLSNFLFC